MKIETVTTRLWEAHTPDPMHRYFEPENKERDAIQDLIIAAETAILKDALHWGPEGIGESIFIFREAPFTVLVTDPKEMPVPPDPRLYDHEQYKMASAIFDKICEPWGGPGIVESIVSYASENPEFKPFTVLGFWSDTEVGGLFGLVQGNDLITVLFG